MKISTNSVGVRTFNLFSDSTHLAILDENAEVRILKLKLDGDKEFIGYDSVYHSFDLISKSVIYDNLNIGVQISWHPTDLKLSLPSSNGSVTIISKESESAEDWKENYLVTDLSSLSQELKDCNIVSYSPCKKYLLSADIAGNVLIWDLATQEPAHIISCAPGNALMHTVWKKSNNMNADPLVMLLTSTHIGNFKIPNANAKISNASSKHTDSAIHNDKTHNSSVSRTETNNSKKPDQDKAVVASDKPRASDTFERNANTNTDTNPNDNGNDNENDDVSIMDTENDSADQIDAEEIKQLLAFSKSVNESKQKPPFQPSSTVYDDKGRRYLVWNAVGNIITREDGINNRIEIKFANIDGPNKPEAFPDNYGFTMAALSYEGAFFATSMPPSDELQQPDEEEAIKPGSTLHYHAFPNQRNITEANETFTKTLPNNEEALAVAAGATFVAVATSKNYLRLFSTTGIQLLVTHLKGSVLCLTGTGSKLAVFYYTGENSKEVQVEVFEISPIFPIKNIVSISVPLPKKDTLIWAGFEFETGMLNIMNSGGIVSSLLHFAGWQWVPVFDTSLKQSLDYKFWPIAIKASHFCYVFLNGETSPAIYPQPVVVSKPFKIPIVESRESKDRESNNERYRDFIWRSCKLNHLEDQIIELESKPAFTDRSYVNHLQNLLSQQKIDFDKSILKIFQEACKSQNLPLASDLGGRLKTENAFLGGIKIANHFGRIQIANKLEKLLHKLREREEEAAMMMNSYDEPIAPPPPSSIPNTTTDYKQHREPIVHSTNHHQSPIAMPPPPAASAAAASGLSKIFNDRKKIGNVTPEDDESNTFDDDFPGIENKPIVSNNPFVRTCPLSPPLKRKNFIDNLSELKNTPSPKRPQLSVLLI